eukprot:5808910-Prymnesium_polylepis.1
MLRDERAHHPHLIPRPLRAFDAAYALLLQRAQAAEQPHVPSLVRIGNRLLFRAIVIKLPLRPTAVGCDVQLLQILGELRIRSGRSRCGGLRIRSG